MKQRIFLLITIFLYFILVFCIGKIAFLLLHSAMGGGITSSDALQAIYHGLPLDMSMSGYLTAIPALILISSIWLKPKLIAKIMNVYFAIFLSLVAIITVVDLVVYPYWGFHFDSSVFLYLQKPKETFASASGLEILSGILASAVFFAIIYIGYIFIIRKQVLHLTVPKDIWKTCLVMVLLTGALFLPIRGGVTVSTMNVGKAYFSDNMFLNHAAINPHFNLMYSFFKSDNFASQYQFYDKDEAIASFDKLMSHPHNDSIPQLLNTSRPNIILFILESFSSVAALDSVVAPNMTRFAKEGILFDNFYANSFRTDRGLVSILSGYPAHPTVAIMKYPQKTENLPTITRELKQIGYENLSFYYGGDADFANMRSYFVGACGIKDVFSDKDFPLSERMTKWGAPDKYLIDRVYYDLTAKEQKTPFIKTVLTLSSHEPFDVPVDKFEEPFLNAVSYTDECLGGFVDKLKTDSSLWNNTLIIFVADHAMQSYPGGLNNSDPQRFRIPMIWLGGAVKEPRVISDYGSQNDLAATLLSQMKLKYEDFRFSTDMLNPDSRKFAFYSYVNGFCMTDSTGTVTYDNDKQEIINQNGNPELEKEAKTFFQNMYIDLGNR
ncbi:LTA synthase family protein [Prevotella sp. 10(H)]|uniref:LTA synthase family protein n=1 Tax=Prevotella sp. 10(H) TaxID=1158294 RepID=UPI0004A6CA8B|nr:alkaline phosphatase family protein [Prevotella sp. 10(H)]